MHIPTFILCFFAIGTPLIYLAALLKPASKSVAVYLAIAIAAWLSWGSAPLDSDDCRPAGTSIYNDC